MHATENKSINIPGAPGNSSQGSSFFFQPKLTINEPGDQYEQEADRMAEHVMRMPLNGLPFFKPSPISISRLQRKCKDCEEEEKMQRKESSSQPAGAGNDISSYIGSLPSKGSPLPDSARSFFEPRFGRDFSGVKIHNDADAAKSSQAVNALAYTVGNNIVFNQGQYSPGTDSGKRLMAHELTHVVQQSEGINTKIQRLGDLKKVPNMFCDVPTTGAPAPALTSLFTTSATALNPAQRNHVAAFATNWRANGATDPIRVDGYASTAGPDEMNWQLSCDRAVAISNELTINGVPENFVTTFAQGETFEFGAQQNNQRADISTPGAPQPQAPPAAPPGPGACATGAAPQPSVSACIQPVIVAETNGSDPLVAPSFAAVQSIWGKCCINVTVNNPITVNNSALKEIDDAGSGAPMTAEETTLFSTAGAGCIPVAVVDTIRRGAAAGKQVAGGGTTKGFLTNNPKVIVVEGTESSVVAHEVGHAFTCSHNDDVGGTTVMHPSGAFDIPEAEGVNVNICNKARSSPSALASGVDQCCLDTV